MDTVQNKRNKHSIRVIYALAFIFSFAIAIPTYINSTFIAEFVGERYVGLVFTLGAILAVTVLAFLPLLLRRIGNVKTTILGVTVGIISLLGVAFISTAFAVVPLFVVYLAVTRQVGYNADLFLENYSEDKSTGSVRGAFLSITNIAWVFAPVIAGYILGEDNYWIPFTLAIVLFAILIPIIIKNFKGYEDPSYDRAPFWETFKIIWNRKNVYRLFAGYFLLRFFFAWMVIYTPIYLHEHIGIPWNSIGLIFTIMLIPFVILEYPLGRIADTKLGEKEMMSVGFIILALTTVSLAFITSSAVWVWALALFLTRVGASTVQVMGETYFFKKIDGSDSELLSFFRMLGPLSYVVAPLLASIVLAFVDFRFLYLVLGILMLWGLRYSLTLRDTL